MTVVGRRRRKEEWNCPHQLHQKCFQLVRELGRWGNGNSDGEERGELLSSIVPKVREQGDRRL